MMSKRLDLHPQKDPFEVKITVPQTISNKDSLDITIKSNDPASVILSAGEVLAILTERYGVKPTVLILP